MERAIVLIARLVVLVFWPLVFLATSLMVLPLGGIFYVVGISFGFLVVTLLGSGLQLTLAVVIYLLGMINLNTIDQSTTEQPILGNAVAGTIYGGFLLGMFVAHLLY